MVSHPARSLQQIADDAVARGVPGVVALVAHGDEVDLAVAGHREVDGAPMTRDTIVRIASLTKPVVGAAAMALVERGTIAVDDHAVRWLPELDGVQVLRSTGAELDDTEPLAEPITVWHVLTCTAGVGFVGDFDAPSAVAQQRVLGQGPDLRAKPAADEWMRRLGTLPLAHQPGAGWTYDAGMDLLGILVERASGTPLRDLVAELVLGPLGMVDTGFALPEADTGRTATGYRHGDDGLEVAETPRRLRDEPPAFDSGAGGLLSTADDLLRFWRMIVAEGELGGVRALSEESVRLMRTPHATAEAGNMFLDDQAWGIGGAVDVSEGSPFHAVGRSGRPARFGWIGGTGTAAYALPNGTIGIWLSQLELGAPDDFEILGGFLTEVARRDAARV